MQNLNVCYTVNQKYLNPMLVSIYSLLENNSNLNICFYIIYEDLPLEEQEKIEQIVLNFSNCQLFMYNINHIFPEMEQYKIPNWRGTKIANARLFLSNIIPNCPDSILYLDSDTIVVGNLNELIHYSQKEPLSAVLDHISKAYWQSLNPELTHYFNSGVLKIDFNLWEKCSGNERIMNTLRKNYHLTFPDQDILNIAFQDKIETLPLAYNLFPMDLFFDIFTLQKSYKNNKVEFYSQKEILSSRKNSKILHTTNFYGLRPWRENKIYPFQTLYLYYLTKIYGNSIPLEESHISYANMDPRLFKLIEYLKFYTPTGIKNELKRALRKQKENE